MTESVENHTLYNEALRIVGTILQEKISEEEHRELSNVLDTTLLRELLQIAWKHQFDKDYSIFKRTVRKLIRDRVRDTNEDQ